MQIVGDHLSSAAISRRGKSREEDLFARSAFNRYYYAVFLVSRQFLKETTGAAGLAHKALPQHLSTTFKNQVKRKLKAAQKAGLVSNSAHSKLLTNLTSNVQLLSQLLSEAYRVRVLADYEPDIAVELENQTYKLGAITLAAATGWEGRAHFHCKNLRQIWSELGN